MRQAIESIRNLFTTWTGKEPVSIDILPQSGSERRYFRLKGPDGNSIIGTYGANKKENESFFYFSEKFISQNLPVAQVRCVSDDRLYYLQKDFGDTSLISRLEAEGFSPGVYTLFKKSLVSLAQLQVQGDKELDYNYCLTNKEFGKQAIMADLFYFKYYFLDALRKPYDKQKLIDDFEALSNYLTHTEYKYFMFRDFQSRNIMVSDNESIHFIDYQGGMKGAPQYDVASLLWQARANLPADWKERLLDDYIQAFEHIIQSEVDKTVFKSQYHGYVLIRLLQVLGAYGFRGLFERKAHFLTSIPQALTNLKYFINNHSIGIAVPEFKKVLDICIQDDIISQFTPPQAKPDSSFKIKVHSFSFKKGIPADESGNGGGYVFDCRGILNPGRYDEYKELTGRDKPVIDFLEQQTRMPEFLNSVFDMVDISVEDYLKRDFDHLSICFGCTGGQHRSVYAADALARHLRNKFKVKIELIHREQDIKEQKGY